MKISNTPSKLIADVTDSAVTKRVKFDFNVLTAQQFLSKYQTTKEVYFKRVLKYGNPYMRVPLAKIGKWLAKRK